MAKRVIWHTIPGPAVRYPPFHTFHIIAVMGGHAPLATVAGNPSSPCHVNHRPMTESTASACSGRGKRCACGPFSLACLCPALRGRGQTPQCYQLDGVNISREAMSKAPPGSSVTLRATIFNAIPSFSCNLLAIASFSCKVPSRRDVLLKNPPPPRRPCRRRGVCSPKRQRRAKQHSVPLSASPTPIANRQRGSPISSSMRFGS